MKLAWITDSSLIRGFREIKTRITSGLIESSKASFPVGFASNPAPTFIAIVAETMSNDEPVIVGYLDPNVLEDLNIGDSIMYSTSEGGTKTAKLYLRADGTAEILGNADNAVRFQKLDDGLKAWQTAIQAELTKIATGITGAGGTYTPGILDLNIDNSKIDEIKVL